jgi:two-component system response regulator AlgR
VRWSSCDSLQPDIVLLDVRMPGIDGLEVARQLATQPEPPAVIFITAFDEYALQAFESRGHRLSAEADPRRETAGGARQGRPAHAAAVAAGGQRARESRARTHIGVRGRDGLKLIPVEEVLLLPRRPEVHHGQAPEGRGPHRGLAQDARRGVRRELRAHPPQRAGQHPVSRADLPRDASGQHFVHLRGLPDALEVSRRMAGDLKDRFRI